MGTYEKYRWAVSRESHEKTSCGTRQVLYHTVACLHLERFEFIDIPVELAPASRTMAILMDKNRAHVASLELKCLTKSSLVSNTNYIIITKKKPVQSGTNELLPPYSTHEAASKIGGQRQRKGRTWHCEQVFRNLDEAFDEVGG